MTKLLSATLLTLITLPLFSQSGQPLTEIFADFHYYNTKDTSFPEKNGFGLNRAFLGYTYQPSTDISATVIVNIGSPSDIYAGKERRYAHFREASVTWTSERTTMSFGMTQTRSLIFQQKFYGKRYIADNFEAINGFSTVSDLGFSFDYVFNDAIKIDFTLMNGEGYNNLHVDNSIKTSFGINIIPFKNGVVRLYSDFDHPSGIWQQLYIGFLGYKSEVITIGGEVAYKTNTDKVPGHDSWGLSVTGSVSTSEKTEIFGRYDYTSAIPGSSDPTSWNYKSDRQFFVAGFQYTLNEYLRLAIDYQGNYPLYRDLYPSDGILLNLHFKF